MCVVCALVGLCKEASGSDPQNTEVSCVRAEGVCVSVCPTLTRHTSVTEAPSPYTHTNIHTYTHICTAPTRRTAPLNVTRRRQCDGGGQWSPSRPPTTHSPHHAATALTRWKADDRLLGSATTQWDPAAAGAGAAAVAQLHTAASASADSAAARPTRRIARFQCRDWLQHSSQRRRVASRSAGRAVTRRHTTADRRKQGTGREPVTAKTSS